MSHVLQPKSLKMSDLQATFRSPFSVTDVALETIKKHFPSIKTQQDTALWVAKASEPQLLTQCLNANVFDHIIDWKKFIKALSSLKQNPYLKDDKGEDPTQYLKVRDALANIVFHSLDQTSSKRYSFAAWALWNSPSNKSKMYMPITTIVFYCNKQELDLEEFYKQLRKHPGGAKGVMISADLSEAEARIVTFLEKASSFNICPPKYTDLDDNQNSKIASILTAPYSALQGGAGVGKTTTVGKLILSIVSSPIPVVVHCLAFTHKAKRCILEKLASNGLVEGPSLKVSTIHSFIATQRVTENKLPPSFVLIDESSMIDIELLSTLAQTLMDSCPQYQLSFVGDMMQLPPITRGEFFRFLVSNQGAHLNELKKCYRTDKPDLFDAYEMIRKGELPTSTDNFHVVTVDSDKDINSHIGKLIYKNIHDIGATQFIAWQNKDVFKINQWIQAALLKSNKIGPGQFKGFYYNDKVIYRGENTKTLTNAMIGRVVDASPRSMAIQWDDGQRTNFTTENAKSIQLAYALTVHCLQGSECSKVIVACYEVGKMISCLDRRFLYTGVSRGKESVVVVTTPDIKSFLKRDVKTAPLTGLRLP